jgi:hypothetical protein
LTTELGKMGNAISTDKETRRGRKDMGIARRFGASTQNSSS